MKLDFSALDSIPYKGEDPAEDFKHSEPLITIDYSKARQTPPAPARGPKQLKLIYESTTTQNNPEKAEEGLEIIEDAEQVNIFEDPDGSHLKKLISKGIRRGEDPLQLLLKAIECISLLSGDRAFYEKNRERMASIYGAGMGREAALELELIETQGRITRLKYSLNKEDLTEKERETIEAAIRENQEREKQLKATL